MKQNDKKWVSIPVTATKTVLTADNKVRLLILLNDKDKSVKRKTSIPINWLTLSKDRKRYEGYLESGVDIRMSTYKRNRSSTDELIEFFKTEK